MAFLHCFRNHPLNTRFWQTYLGSSQPPSHALELRRWIRSMTAAPENRCVLHNLFARECMGAKNVSRGLLADFFADLGLMLHEKRGTRGNDRELIGAVARTQARKYFLAGQRRPAQDVRIGRYIAVRRLAHRYGERLPCLGDDDESPKRLKEAIDVGIVKATDLTIQRGDSELPTWVTPVDDVARRPAGDPRTEADYVRDTLGLVWSDCATGAETTGAFALLTYPVGVAVTLGVRAPSMFDAEGSPAFRPRVNRNPKADDGWGRTLDLRTLGDGAREGVHPSLTSFGPDFDLSTTGYAVAGPRQPDYCALLKTSKGQLR